MRLLFINQHLGAFGGAETQIYLAASELRKRDHTLAMLYVNDTGKATADWQNVFHQYVSLTEGHETACVREFVARFQPDLIYLHNLESVAVMTTIDQLGVPVVRMVHDHTPYCLRRYKYNYFTRKTCHRALSPFCVFPCLGSFARNHKGRFPVTLVSYKDKVQELRLARRFSRLLVYSHYCRNELIKNGCSPDRILLHSPLAMRTQDTPTSSFGSRNLVLFAGQIIRGKGVDILLRALARMTEPFECVILGDGNHRAACERLCSKLGLRDRVRFAGYQPHALTRSLYLEASVFAVSSVWPEPFGLVGPEAMRYGLPVVGFNTGGVKEWLIEGENGFLVPWMDTATFAQKLDLLLRDKSLGRDMGRRGQQRVRKLYDVSSQIARLETVFQEVIAEEQTTSNETHLLSPVYGNRQ
ncbi:MAG TPA: glycosyltransferase family 4 protein [Clostridia bacterium]|nr:glycosyltransferase family 4 protein [Clostridia bacterium]